MTEVKKRVVLTKEGLKHDLQVEGLTRSEMAKKYGIPETQMKKALEMAGLKGVKATRVLFELQDSAEETTDTSSPSVQ